MLHFKNSQRRNIAALLRTLYHLSAQFDCLISAYHLSGVTNSVADALSRGWLKQFFELSPHASSTPTVINLCDLDFSDTLTAEARCPCKDTGWQFLMTIYPEGIFPGSAAVSVDGPATQSAAVAQAQGRYGAELPAVPGLPASGVSFGFFDYPELSGGPAPGDGASMLFLGSS